jgi:TRAP-type uncharacterized transport system substrate-binding protein
VRKFFLAAGAVFLTLILTVTVAIVVHKPGPDGKIVIATGGGGGAYHELAELYRRDLARYGVEAELRPKVEGNDTLKALFARFKAEFSSFDESTADIEAGFIKGGFAGSLQGRLASAKEQFWHQRLEDNLRSIGRLFYEPVWVFTPAGEKIRSLRELKNKKIYVGTAVSGSRRVARHLLQANGVDATNATLIEQDLPEDAAPLLARQADAAIVIAASELPIIQKLLRNPKLSLMDFASEVDAYTNRFPSLSKLILRQGAVEFDPDTPSTDITLIATSAVLVVRADLHPSLVNLLANAVIHNPKSGTDKAGDPILFYRAGEFPNGNDPEFELHPGARQLYKTGELPILLRSFAPMAQSLGLPFWVTAFASEHGARTVLLLIPILSILVPLMRILPILYNWMQRRSLLYWYRQLKTLEHNIDIEPTENHIAEKQAELERIDAAVSRIRVPLYFSNQLYDLRSHIDLVRRRLTPRFSAPIRAVAAE